MCAGVKVATFLLLADPQVGSFGLSGPELTNLSDFNGVLNNIATVQYPQSDKSASIKLSCTGPIGTPNATFFAGDMTNYGGHWDRDSFRELLAGGRSNAATYKGGPQLRAVRSLYDPSYSDSKLNMTKLTDCGPLYFGLGNHDLINNQGFWLTWSDYEGELTTKYEDYFRYQMWNFISQMHTGYHRNLNNETVNTAPRFPIAPENIDSDPNGSYYFQNYSLNYKVDLGPVDVYQLHLFGGDRSHGRKSGLDWLKRKLAAGGYTRPVIIVQHVPVYGDPDTDYWTDLDKNYFLAILRPYNVLAIAVGHSHSLYEQTKIALTTPVDVRNDHHIYQILPGSVTPDPKHTDSDGRIASRFAIVRVEESPSGDQVTLDTTYGTVKQDERPARAQWNGTWTNTTTKTEMYVRGIKVVDLPQDADDETMSLPWYVTEEAGQSANINAGYGGRSVYLMPLLTSDKDSAYTGFDVVIRGMPNEWEASWKDIGDMGILHRYLVPENNTGQNPIRQLFLLRSHDIVRSPRPGWNMTRDLNEARGGDHVYLEWQI